MASAAVQFAGSVMVSMCMVHCSLFMPDTVHPFPAEPRPRLVITN